MFLEAALILQMDIERKILHDAKKSIPDPHQRFIEAEQKEDKRTRELFEKLLETMERESWRNWDLKSRN